MWSEVAKVGVLNEGKVVMKVGASMQRFLTSLCLVLLQGMGWEGWEQILLWVSAFVPLLLWVFPALVFSLSPNSSLPGFIEAEGCVVWLRNESWEWAGSSWIRLDLEAWDGEVLGQFLELGPNSRADAKEHTVFLTDEVCLEGEDEACPYVCKGTWSSLAWPRSIRRCGKGHPFLKCRRDPELLQCPIRCSDTDQ